jgi:hypothetical protein
LAEDLYGVIDELQDDHAATTGLLPDFAVHPATSPAPAGAFFLEGPNDGAYNYNACRTPWRIATDFLVSGDMRARTAVERINDWIQTSTGGDPAEIRSGYALSGTPLPGRDYLSMAFVAPLGVGAMVDGSNQAWLNDVWDLVVATPLSAEGYYENTLKLLAMIVMSGNWWAPQAVSGGCTPEGTALCSNPGAIVGAEVKLSRLGAPLGDESLRLKGKLFFAQGIPLASLDGGAQILVEDLGAGAATVFDLTHATTPIPSSSVAPCGDRDGWTTKGARTQYRNRSGSLDPPACNLGSAHGLTSLRYKERSTLDLDWNASASRSSLGSVVGPLRVTLVLDDTEAAGDAGHCGVSPALTCEANGSGTTMRCR